MRVTRAFLFTAALVPGLAAPVRAQVDAPPTDALLQLAAPTFTFGSAVATDGTVLAAVDDANVFLYARTAALPSWVLQASIPLDGATWTATRSVAVDGERVAVGQQATTEHPAGLVRSFVRSGSAWLPDWTLAPSDGASDDAFGASVSQQGSTMVIGAPGHGVGGAVYVFQRGWYGWWPVAELVASDAAPGDALGFSVSLDGDVLVAGAVSADADGQAHAGAAYVFTGSGASWTQQARLVAPSPQAGAAFGSSVAADGDTIVVGAPYTDVAASWDAGESFAFTRRDSTWSLEGTLVSPAVHDGDDAGFSVALDGDRAIVGVPWATDSTLGALEGAGLLQRYVRVAGAWQLDATLGSSNAESFANMGWSVAIAGDTVAAGAPLHGGGRGAVHVWPWLEGLPPWLDLGYGLGGDSGVPRLEGEGDLVTGTPGAVTLSHGAPSTLMLLVLSTSETPTPFKGGTLLPLPPTLLLPGATNADGNWRAEWTSYPGGLPSFTSVRLQAILVEGGAPAGLALSNVLCATQQD